MTSDNVRSIQGEQTAGPETARINFTGTNAELSGDLPKIGDEQEFTVRAVCKRSGMQLIDDTVTPFRTMKVVEIRPGGITPSEDLEDPSLLSRDDVNEG